jgi:hypothetical protein
MKNLKNKYLKEGDIPIEEDSLFLEKNLPKPKKQFSAETIIELKSETGKIDGKNVQRRKRKIRNTPAS